MQSKFHNISTYWNITPFTFNANPKIIVIITQIPKLQSFAMTLTALSDPTKDIALISGFSRIKFTAVGSKNYEILAKHIIVYGGKIRVTTCFENLLSQLHNKQ